MAAKGNASGYENSVQNPLPWKVGLINTKGKYLTAEKFGYKMNVSGQLLRKNQTWTLERNYGQRVVYIKSHLGNYISVGKYGKVSCEKCDGLGSTEEFMIEILPNGRWAFKNLENSCYFGGIEDNIECFSKSITEKEEWTVQLATHPQIILRSVSRNRYAVMCKDEIHCNTIIPWGEERLLILHFTEGKYALKTCDNRFLSNDGNLVDYLDDNCKFDIELRYEVPDTICLKDRHGFYLTTTGSNATLKRGKRKTPGADDFFVLESCHPQVAITSVNNRKMLSYRQGVDLSANQPEDEEADKMSVFQMEFDKDSKKWAFRTSVDNKYWSLESFGGIQAASKGMTAKTLFDVEPSEEDGTVCIKASNNKYLYNKQTGSILANMDCAESKNFIVRMVNRPFLILKCDYGFVALKSESAQKSEVMCNKTSYEPTFIEPQEDGYYFLKGKNNKYWTVHDDKSIHADGDTGTVKFCLRFQGQSQLTIRPVIPGGKYLKGEPNSFFAKGEEIDASTIWEY